MRGCKGGIAPAALEMRHLLSCQLPISSLARRRRRCEERAVPALQRHDEATSQRAAPPSIRPPRHASDSTQGGPRWCSPWVKRTAAGHICHIEADLSLRLPAFAQSPPSTRVHGTIVACPLVARAAPYCMRLCMLHCRPCQHSCCIAAHRPAASSHAAQAQVLAACHETARARPERSGPSCRTGDSCGRVAQSHESTQLNLSGVRGALVAA